MRTHVFLTYGYCIDWWCEAFELLELVRILHKNRAIVFQVICPILIPNLLQLWTTIMRAIPVMIRHLVMSQTSAVQLNLSSASLLYVWRNSGYLWRHVFVLYIKVACSGSPPPLTIFAHVLVLSHLYFLDVVKLWIKFVLLLQILTDLSFSDMCRHGTLSVVCMMKQLQDVLLEGIFTNMRGKWLDEHPSWFPFLSNNVHSEMYWDETGIKCSNFLEADIRYMLRSSQSQNKCKYSREIVYSRLEHMVFRFSSFWISAQNFQDVWIHTSSLMEFSSTSFCCMEFSYWKEWSNPICGSVKNPSTI